MPCYALACFSSSIIILFRQFSLLTKSFGLPARHVLRENMFEAAFPQFWWFRIAACFGVITACLGVNAACFPVHPKNWFLRGANTEKLVWFWWWGLKVICSNLLVHVHAVEYKCMWAVKWVASTPQMVDRDLPITNLQGHKQFIKSKVVWFSVTASFYQLRRVLDNAACSGKCRQNFSSIPLRPKFWQHEFIGMGLSKNSGTAKSSILIGFSIINHPFWGPTPFFGNIHMLKLIPSCEITNVHKFTRHVNQLIPFTLLLISWSLPIVVCSLLIMFVFVVGMQLCS